MIIRLKDGRNFYTRPGTVISLEVNKEAGNIEFHFVDNDLMPQSFPACQVRAVDVG